MEACGEGRFLSLSPTSGSPTFAPKISQRTKDQLSGLLTLLLGAIPASSDACFSRRRFCLASRFLRETADPSGSDWVERGRDLGRPRESLKPQSGGRKEVRGK